MPGIPRHGRAVKVAKVSSVVVTVLFMVGTCSAITLPLDITVTSQSASSLQYRVFNPVTQSFVSHTRNASPSTIGSVTNSGGILAWVETRSDGRRDVWMSTWLPGNGWIDRSQSAASGGFGQNVSPLRNLNGVVCWLE